MKKIRTLLALAMALCMMLGVAMAEQPTATAHKAAGIVIDGDLSDWNLADPIVIDGGEVITLDEATAKTSNNGDTEYNVQLVRDEHFWNGPDDLSAKFYIAWDEENLYIAADVTEDSIFGVIEGLELDGMDNFQLYISTDPTADPERTAYGTNDFLLYMMMDGEYWDTAFDRSMITDKEVRKRFVSKGMDGGENVLEGYAPAATQTTTGFIFECAIPWSNFVDDRGEIALFTPVVGDTINFNVVLTDISYPCPGTEYVPQIAWTGSYITIINTNPSSWGRLTFAE